MIELISEHTHQQSNILDCHPKNQQTSSKGIVVEVKKKKKKQKQQQEQVTIQTKFDTPAEIYQMNLINNNLNQSLKLLPNNVALLVNNRVKLSQDEVYLGVLGKQKNYLERIYEGGGEDTSQYHKQLIDNLVKQISSNIQIDINKGKYDVHHKIRVTKEQLKSGRDPKKFRELQSRLSENLNMLKSQITIDSQTTIHAVDFNPTGQKTKEAQLFVRKMQEQKREQAKRRAIRKMQRQKFQVKSMQQKRQFQQMMKQEENQKKKKQLYQKLQFKKKVRQQREKEKQQFNEFLKQYKTKKPLYKKKQQQYYKNFVLQQNKKRLNILTNIKEQKRPIDIDQILDHQRGYLNYKEDREDERWDQKQSAKKQKMKNRKNYYKSKFHSLIQEPQQEQSEYNRSQLYQKRWEYASLVKDKFRPKPSIQKSRQMQQLMEKQKWSQKHGQTKKVAYKQGVKNLQRLHQLIAECRAKGKLKPQIFNTLQVSKTPQYANYLEQFRKGSESSRYKSRTIDYESIAEKDLGYANMQAKVLDNNARRRQMFINNSHEIDIDRHMQQLGKLDEQYMASAKVKVGILNQMH